MHLENHIADYQRALVENDEGFIRNALLRLQYSPLVQIISFLEGDVLARELHTLRAVSPQMRLDAETLAWTPDHEEECVSATVWFEELHFRLRATAEAPRSQRLAHSVWWAGACRLPVKATVNNARSDVLKLLSDGPKEHIEALKVQLSSLPTCTRSKAATCDGQCKSILCNLSAFPNLKKLSIQCGQSVNAKKAAAYVTKVLRSVAQLPVSEVELSDVTQLGNFAALSGAPHLQSLTAKSCGIKSLSELLSCPCLSKLDIKYNPLVESLSVLAGLPTLERLCAQGCNLRNLEELGRCPRLSYLDVSSNDRLTSTKGLAGAAQLKKLNINCCEALNSLEGLSSCPLLEDLDVQFDTALESFQGLAGAPSLRYINANGCALRNVDGLSSCPQLNTIDVSENGSLDDLSGLAGAPSLRLINATDSGLRRLTGLGRCPALEEVLLNACEVLEDISGLAGAPSLVTVSAMNCQISNVSGLGSCPRLAELDLSGSDPLVDIRDLARCPSLRILNVNDTGVTNTDFLSPSVEVLCNALVPSDSESS